MVAMQKPTFWVKDTICPKLIIVLIVLVIKKANKTNHPNFISNAICASEFFYPNFSVNQNVAQNGSGDQLLRPEQGLAPGHPSGLLRGSKSNCNRGTEDGRVPISLNFSFTENLFPQNRLSFWFTKTDSPKILISH